MVMRSFAALSVAVLAACVSESASSSSPVTIPLTKLQRTGAYLKGSPEADRARAAFFKSRKPGRPTSVPLTNLAYVQYTTRIGIGNPPTYYNLVVDTGSSNTFCGTGTPYARTSTSFPTGDQVNVTYGLGYFTGVQYLDQVTLAPNLVLVNQSIGDALSFADFSGVDGIVGVGPPGLTNGSLLPDANATIPTVMNNLVSQGLIEHEVLGVYFAPSTNYSDQNGALTYGGVDSRLCESKLTYVSLTDTYPAGYYWGVNVTTATYGRHAVIPTSIAGIVDTGTTQILLADDFFATYMSAIPGAKWDANATMLEIPQDSVAKMLPLTFVMGDRHHKKAKFVMDVAAQLIPMDQNAAWGVDVQKQYGVVGKLGSQSGQGLDFILGQKFMERYYAAFDAKASRVGFAKTNNTFTTYHG